MSHARQQLTIAFMGQAMKISRDAQLAVARNDDGFAHQLYFARQPRHAFHARR